MSSGRLGPASRAPSCRRRRKRRQPARPGQQVHGLADDRLLERRPGRGGVRRRRAGAVAAAAEPVQFHAQPDQVFQRVDVDIPGHDRGHRRVARDALGGVPVQPDAAVAAGLGRGRAVRGPPCPDLRGPLLLQCRIAVEQHQVGQGDVRPHLHRLPGPLRAAAWPRPAAASPRPARRGTAGPGSGHRPSRPEPTARPAPWPPPRRIPGSGPRSGPPRRRTWSPAAPRGRRTPGPGPRPAGRRGPARTSRRTAPTGPPAPAPRPRPRPAAHRTGPGTFPAACPSTGRWSARRTPTGPRRPAPPPPSDAFHSASPTRCGWPRPPG